MQDPLIPVVGKMARDHPGTISLGQGVVYYGPPPEATAQIGRFLAAPDSHKYQAVEGIPELVAAVAAKLRAENGIVTGEESRIVVTAGGNMAFLAAVLTVADPGDEIVLQTPFYFNHEMAVAMAGCRPVAVATDAAYQLRVGAIAAAITPRTRAVLTVSPNNPSGAVYPEADLAAVNDLCRRRGLYHIHDEAYEYFTYGDACPFSPGALPGAAAHTISLYSLSKAYGFASWRIGYMVLPAHLWTAIQKVQDTMLICPPVISQYAAVGALHAGAAYCHARRGVITENRDRLLRVLEPLRGFVTIPQADGAFYLLLRVATDLPAMTVVERLIQEHGVAVMPGTTFGLTEGCFLRVAYGALEEATAAEGMGRLVRGLRALAGGAGR